MKTIKYFIIGFALITFVSACDIDTVENPNAPTAESLLDGATLADLRLLAQGVESAIRNDMEFYYWTTSIVGREYYDLNGTDPRYTGELLGAEGAVLDNNGFLTTRAWATAYRAARNAINLEIATANTSASLTQAEINGLVGYAKTLRAYALHLELNRQYQNGLKIDIQDPNNVGPLVSYSESLDALADLLDEAADDLQGAGDDFVFSLSSGFSGFDTPATFAQFNRALRARLAIYQDDNATALSALQGSFLDMAGSMELGVYHAFGTSGNDIRNPLFNVPNNDLYTVHPTWLDDAEDGDTRVDAKTTPLDPDEIDLPVTLDGLSGTVQVTLYSSDVDQVPLMRNEELLLIYAEANIGSDNGAAADALNLVRTAAGLDAYSGGMDDASLTDELLNQRRYSLFGEGHRWVDLRRYGRIDQIPTDRAGDVVHVQFPTPELE